MKIMKVYTRSGDKGATSIVGGFRLSKDDVRIEAYGTIDELNAHLGLLVSLLPEGDDKAQVLRAQHCLFNVSTHLATDQSRSALPSSAHLPQQEISHLEAVIDEVMQQLPEPQGFILPGGTQAAAQAHVCRTVCRRAERRIVTLARASEVSPEVLQYVNRLSDYLFALAKKINFNTHVDEIIWENVCK